MEVSRLQILRTDASGMPLEWIGYQEAVKLYYLDQVAYTCGLPICSLRGGINALSGQRSILEVNSILATHCPNSGRFKNFRNYTPPLNNAALFRRDNHLCLYCGQHFSRRELSRDHITPVSQGGQDIWSNVVTACKRCNNHKAGRTPEQANIQLLAIPFIPTHAEYIYLQGHMILADQMAFLRAHFPRSSPLITRAA
jgi:5-methylcytosine-specific restriction endonuclease McrA